MVQVFCFAAHVVDHNFQLSEEHTEYCWVDCPRAMELLHWDMDKTAVWELGERIRRGELLGTPPPQQ